MTLSAQHDVVESTVSSALTETSAPRQHASSQPLTAPTAQRPLQVQTPATSVSGTPVPAIVSASSSGASTPTSASIPNKPGLMLKNLSRLNMLKPLRSKHHAPLATPKPVNLPSMRSQNAGLDPYVSLVPTGTSTTWGLSQLKGNSTPQSPSTPTSRPDTPGSRPTSAQPNPTASANASSSSLGASRSSWAMPSTSSSSLLSKNSSPFSAADFPSPAEVSAKQTKRRESQVLHEIPAGSWAAEVEEDLEELDVPSSTVANKDVSSSTASLPSARSGLLSSASTTSLRARGPSAASHEMGGDARHRTQDAWRSTNRSSVSSRLPSREGSPGRHHGDRHLPPPPARHHWSAHEMRPAHIAQDTSPKKILAKGTALPVSAPPQEEAPDVLKPEDQKREMENAIERARQRREAEEKAREESRRKALEKAEALSQKRSQEKTLPNADVAPPSLTVDAKASRKMTILSKPTTPTSPHAPSETNGVATPEVVKNVWDRSPFVSSSRVEDHVLPKRPSEKAQAPIGSKRLEVETKKEEEMVKEDPSMRRRGSITEQRPRSSRGGERKPSIKAERRDASSRERAFAREERSRLFPSSGPPTNSLLEVTPARPASGHRREGWQPWSVPERQRATSPVLIRYATSKETEELKRAETKSAQEKLEARQRDHKPKEEEIVVTMPSDPPKRTKKVRSRRASKTQLLSQSETVVMPTRSNTVDMTDALQEAKRATVRQPLKKKKRKLLLLSSTAAGWQEAFQQRANKSRLSLSKTSVVPQDRLTVLFPFFMERFYSRHRHSFLFTVEDALATPIKEMQREPSPPKELVKPSRRRSTQPDVFDPHAQGVLPDPSYEAYLQTASTFAQDAFTRSPFTPPKQEGTFSPLANKTSVIGSPYTPPQKQRSASRSGPMAFSAGFSGHFYPAAAPPATGQPAASFVPSHHHPLSAYSHPGYMPEHYAAYYQNYYRVNGGYDSSLMMGLHPYSSGTAEAKYPYSETAFGGQQAGSAAVPMPTAIGSTTAGRYPTTQTAAGQQEQLAAAAAYHQAAYDPYYSAFASRHYPTYLAPSLLSSPPATSSVPAHSARYPDATARYTKDAKVAAVGTPDPTKQTMPEKTPSPQ